MVKLFEATTRALIGTITEEQLEQVIAALEEESTADRDYYINRATIDLLQTQGVDKDVVDLLILALGSGDEMDIRWESA